MSLQSVSARQSRVAPWTTAVSIETARVWARLLAKVDEVDVLPRNRCGSPMKMLAVITDPYQCRRILLHLTKTSAAPPRRGHLRVALTIPIPLPASRQCLVVPGDHTAPSEAPDRTITPPGAGFPNGRGSDSRAIPCIDAHFGITRAMSFESMRYYRQLLAGAARAYGGTLPRL